MKLSLTLPTLFPGPAARIIENVRATVRDIDYEIVVVSPFEVSGPDIRWIKEETPKGCGAAHAVAYENSTGDVICPLADDAEFRPGWAEDGYQSLLKFERGRPYAIGIGQTNQMVGTVFGIYYPFFPMLRRTTMEAIGGFYLPQLRHHFTDSDFALRIWSIGGACGFTERDYIERKPRDTAGFADTAMRLDSSRNESLKRDMETFLGLWGARYGKGWNARELRSINIDVDPIFRMFVADGNTIYVNHPKFAEAHQHYVQMMGALHQGRDAARSA